MIAVVLSTSLFLSNFLELAIPTSWKKKRLKKYLRLQGLRKIQNKQTNLLYQVDLDYNKKLKNSSQCKNLPCIPRISLV